MIQYIPQIANLNRENEDKPKKWGAFPENFQSHSWSSFSPPFQSHFVYRCDGCSSICCHRIAMFPIKLRMIFRQTQNDVPWTMDAEKPSRSLASSRAFCCSACFSNNSTCGVGEPGATKNGLKRLEANHADLDEKTQKHGEHLGNYRNLSI